MTECFVDLLCRPWLSMVETYRLCDSGACPTVKPCIVIIYVQHNNNSENKENVLNDMSMIILRRLHWE